MTTKDEAPMFKSEPTGCGEKYLTSSYDAKWRRSLVVQSSVHRVGLTYHMHGASYVSLDFTADEARAVAAELIAAADASQQEEAA